MTGRERVQAEMDFELFFVDGRCRLETSGTADVPTFKNVMLRVLQDPRWQSNTQVLLDHTNLDLRALSNEDVQQVARDSLSLATQLTGSWIAIVLPGDLGFGLGRVWQSVVEHPTKTPDEHQTRIFRSRAEAEDWLNRRSGPAPVRG